MAIKDQGQLIRLGLTLILGQLIFWSPPLTFGKDNPYPVIIVTSENDSFDGDTHNPDTLKLYPGRDRAISLREAIETANRSPNPVIIRFSPAQPSMVITLDTPLPPIKYPVIIDGTSSHDHRVTLQGPGTTAHPPIDGLTLASQGSIIRGLVIQHFSGNGVVIRGNANILESNTIGSDFRDPQNTGNGGNGILISGNNNIIGAPVPTTQNIIARNRGNGVIIEKGAGNKIVGNLIAGNLGSGIEIQQGQENRIQGNFVGTDESGQTQWGNHLDGISVFGDHTLIGGPEPKSGNTIAFNQREGIAIFFGQGNTLRGNSIHHNKGLAINLQQDQVTPNDHLDKDQGPNGLQNFPILQSATAHSVNHLFVVGKIQSHPEETFQIDFYSSASPGALSKTEAFSFLGSDSVKTNENGEGEFASHLGIGLSPGEYITAIATHKDGNSSELAPGIQVDWPNPQIIWEPIRKSISEQPIFEASFTEGMAPIPLLPPNIHLKDVDSQELSLLTVSLSNPLDGDQEMLGATLPSPILSQKFEPGTLTVTGKASLPIYEQVLNQLTYYNASPNPTLASRHLTVTVGDGEFMSQPFMIRITVSGTNSPPLVSWVGVSADLPSGTYDTEYREGQSPLHFVSKTATLHDKDSSHLTRLTVTLLNPVDGEQEVLDVTTTDPAMTSTLEGGILTISGKASIQAYQSTMHTLTYQNLSSTPTEAPRRITLVASDEELASIPVTTKIIVKNINRSPIIGLNAQHEKAQRRTHEVHFSEGSPPIPILPSNVRIRDQDNTELVSLTATLENPVDGLEDVLGVNALDSKLAHNFHRGVLTISGRASLETYQNTLQSLFYQNHSNAPSLIPRVIKVVVSDGQSTSIPFTTQVTLTSTNSLPTIAGNFPDPESPLLMTHRGRALHFMPSDSHIQDVDSTEFIELRAKIQDPSHPEEETLRAQLPDPSLIQQFNESTLVVTGRAPKYVYESVLRSLSYLNHHTSPPFETRDIIIQIQDTQGGMSQPQIVRIDLKIQPPVSALFSQSFFDSLDSVTKTIEGERQHQLGDKQLIVKTVTGSGFVISAGIFIWILRGTSLLASLLATIPVWNSMDPLPVLSMSQEDRWQHLVATQQAENQEEEEFPQFQHIFSHQPSTPSPTEKDAAHP